MKIKKCTSLLLALLVLVSNIGLAVNVHYCGGQIAGISTAYNVSNISADDFKAEEKACCIPKPGERGCCDNKVVKVEKKSDGFVKSFSFQLDAPFVIQNWKPVVFATVAKITQPQTASYYCDAHAPPLYQLYSQYIFYA
jgi:hypothetical protein